MIIVALLNTAQHHYIKVGGVSVKTKQSSRPLQLLAIEHVPRVVSPVNLWSYRRDRSSPLRLRSSNRKRGWGLGSLDCVCGAGGCFCVPLRGQRVQAHESCDRENVEGCSIRNGGNKER